MSDDMSVDQQFRALMEGIRTTLPGVQVLFAFLLILPFQGRFADLRGLDEYVYYLAVMASAVASVLLIAPSAHQRVRGLETGIPRHHLEHIRTAARLTVAGTVAFLVALAAAVYLVSTVVFRDSVAATAVAVVAGLAAWAWFYLPLVEFRRTGDEQRTR